MIIITTGYITRIQAMADPYGFDNGAPSFASTLARVDKGFKKIVDSFGNEVMSDIQIFIKDPAFDIQMGDTVLIGQFTALPTGATPRTIRNLIYATGLKSVHHLEVYL